MGPTEEQFDAFRQTWGTGNQGTGWGGGGLQILDYSQPITSVLSCYVRNTTSTDVAQGEVLWLTEGRSNFVPDHNPVVDTLLGKQSQVYDLLLAGHNGQRRGTTPETSSWYSQYPEDPSLSPSSFVIALEAIPAGGVGLAATGGICLAKFSVANRFTLGETFRNCRYARPGSDRTLLPTQDPGDPLEILDGLTSGPNYSWVKFREVGSPSWTVSSRGLDVGDSNFVSGSAVDLPLKYIGTVRKSNHGFMIHYSCWLKAYLEGAGGSSATLKVWLWTGQRDAGSSGAISGSGRAATLVLDLGVSSGQSLTEIRTVAWHQPFIYTSSAFEVYAGCSVLATNVTSLTWQPAVQLQPCSFNSIRSVTQGGYTTTAPTSPPPAPPTVPLPPEVPPAPPPPPPPPPGTIPGPAGWYCITLLQTGLKYVTYYAYAPVSDPFFLQVNSGPYANSADCYAQCEGSTIDTGSEE